MFCISTSASYITRSKQNLQAFYIAQVQIKKNISSGFRYSSSESHLLVGQKKKTCILYYAKMGYDYRF